MRPLDRTARQLRRRTFPAYTRSARGDIRPAWEARRQDSCLRRLDWPENILTGARWPAPAPAAALGQSWEATRHDGAARARLAAAEPRQRLARGSGWPWPHRPRAWRGRHRQDSAG